MPTDPDQSTPNVFKSFVTFFHTRTMPPWPSWGYLIFAWPFVGMAFLISINVIQSARVAPHQAATDGIITGYDPPNHDQSRYAFTVSGHQYTGESGFPGGNNPPLQAVVTVYYDTRDANTNALQSFASQAQGDGSVALLLFTVGSTIILTVCSAKVWKHFRSRLR